MKKNILFMVVVISICLQLPVSGSPVIGPNDRVAWSADGNNNDSDDWGATPITLAIWAKMGWQDRLVHFDYHSRLDETNDYKEKENEESTLGAAERFRFDLSKFFNDQTQLDKAVANLAKEINASSAESRLWIGVAGPFEVVYRAIRAADQEKTKYITMVSHSPMNEEANKWAMAHGREDCEEFGAKYLKIKTGNGCGDAFGGGKCEKWEDVEWLKNSPDEDYRWIYSRLEATKLENVSSSKPNGKLDASDCTMAYFLAYNDENGSFAKLEEKLGTRWYDRSKPVPYPIPTQDLDPDPVHKPKWDPDKIPYTGPIPSGNRIIMEAEAAITESLGGWYFDTTHEGYCGDGYLFYTGENKNNTDLDLPLVYKWNIEEAGTYVVLFRGRRDKCESCDCDAEGDKCNDIWASLDGSEIKKKLVKHYWGTWGWGWPRMTQDKVPYRVHLDAGIHVLQIGGRSKGVKLDQIAVLPDSEGKPKTNDCLSDGGTGNTAANPECIKLMSVDFEDITAGEAAYFINANHNCLAINAGNVNNRDKWAAAAQPFTGKTGIYNIVLHGLLEWDGESPYRVSVNGKVVGEATNRTAIRSENYDTQKHAFNNIVIKTNDVIKVESMAVTNGKVPEKGGTAYARGRWRAIEFIKITN